MPFPSSGSFQSPRLSFSTAVFFNSGVSAYSAVLSIGAASGDRVVVIGVGAYSNGNALSVSGVTVGGVSAASVVQAETGNSALAAIFALGVPAGTSTAIVATMNVAASQGAFAIYTLLGMNGVATFARSNSTGGVQTLTTTVQAPPNGSVLGVSFFATNALTSTITWTGPTLDSTISTAAGTISVAHMNFANRAQAVQAACSTTLFSGRSSLVVASF